MEVGVKNSQKTKAVCCVSEKTDNQRKGQGGMGYFLKCKLSDDFKGGK